MTIFEIMPTSLSDGSFAATWFDDEKAGWEEERLRKAEPLSGEWGATPAKLALRGARGVTDVLFNPNALAVSARIREGLRGLTEIDFLPIVIDGSGTFFVLHVIACVDISNEVAVRRVPPPSGNIVQVLSFPAGYTAAMRVFRIRQPSDSAAGRAGLCLPSIYANEEGAEIVKNVCGEYLSPRSMSSGRAD